MNRRYVTQEILGRRLNLYMYWYTAIPELKLLFLVLAHFDLWRYYGQTDLSRVEMIHT